MPHSMCGHDVERFRVGQSIPPCEEETTARVRLTREILKHMKWDTLTNPNFRFPHHRCRPAYNTVIRLGASRSLSISLLRVSLGNCFIKPQVQGLLGIHLISGRLSYKVVSALLYCGTMFVLLVGGRGWFFFFCICTVYTKEQCIVITLNG